MTVRRLKRLLVKVRRRVWPRVNVRLAPKCQKCGYSLAGLAGQGVERCPECGLHLHRHEFCGLYRIRGRTAWLVSACGPVLVVFIPLIVLLRAGASAPSAALDTRIVMALSTLLIVAAASAAMVVAMARQASEGKPFLIRGTNWQGAMMSIAVLGVMLAVMLIVVVSSEPGRP